MDRLTKVIKCRYIETVETLTDLLEVIPDINDKLDIHDSDCIITVDCNLSAILETFLYNGFKQSDIIKALQRYGIQVDYKLFKLSIFYVKDIEMYYAINELY